MERGFRSSAVTPVGITIVVCAVITRELLAYDQTNFFFLSCTQRNVMAEPYYHHFYVRVILPLYVFFSLLLGQNVDKWDRNK